MVGGEIAGSAAAPAGFGLVAGTTAGVAMGGTGGAARKSSSDISGVPGRDAEDELIKMTGEK